MLDAKELAKRLIRAMDEADPVVTGDPRGPQGRRVDSDHTNDRSLTALCPESQAFVAPADESLRPAE